MTLSCAETQEQLLHYLPTLLGYSTRKHLEGNKKSETNTSIRMSAITSEKEQCQF
jgi:hypothetical protein